MSIESVSTDDVARFVKDLNEDSEVEVEKILVRVITPTSYACQIWYRGSREPEALGINLTE